MHMDSLVSIESQFNMDSSMSPSKGNWKDQPSIDFLENSNRLVGEREGTVDGQFEGT